MVTLRQLLSAVCIQQDPCVAGASEVDEMFQVRSGRVRSQLGGLVLSVGASLVANVVLYTLISDDSEP